MKRSLPTVTIEDVFDTLKAKEACWYVRDARRSDFKLAQRLMDLKASLGYPENIDVRVLNKAVASGAICDTERAWLVGHMMTKLVPADFTANYEREEDLVAWENPKPKKPKRPRISELKPGTKYKTKYNNDKVYTKLGNFKDVVVHQEFENLCFMTADFTIDAHLADEEVEVVE